MQTMKLNPGEHVDVQIDVSGRTATVRLTACVYDHDATFVQLDGMDCDLDGDAPGTYYLLPHPQAPDAPAERTTP